MASVTCLQNLVADMLRKRLRDKTSDIEDFLTKANRMRETPNLKKDSITQLMMDYNIMPDFKNKDKLERATVSRLGLTKFMQRMNLHTGTSFDTPLSVYARILKSTDAPEAAVAIAGLQTIASVFNSEFRDLSEKVGVADDVMRWMIKCLDEVAFDLVKTKGSSRRFGLLLQGIVTSGGPRGWIKKKLIRECVGWVKEESLWGKGQEEFIKKKMDPWMADWFNARRRPDQRMTFEEFCADPMKWATGGGAKKKKLYDREDLSRTKWGWAVATLANAGPNEVYKQALLEPNIAMVALKEESKTRLVITTPMASYLRQCYILYSLGKPRFLKSTLTNQNLVPTLMQNTNFNYVCIDATKFDQNFPKWMVENFFTYIYDLSCKAGETELSQICLWELEQLRSLEVEIMGERMAYDNGLLSGWRVTSILGSIASALVCEYINERLGVQMDYITQGDDIIMASYQERPAETYTELCAEFGVNTHPDKCLFGDVGEFLKYTYTSEGVYGLPARALRSICYINPWLEKDRERSPVEVSTGWQTLLSRVFAVVPSVRLASQTTALLIRDLHGWAANKEIYRINRKVRERVHLGVQEIKNLLVTPISLGGFGMYEYSGYADAASPILEFDSLSTLQEKDQSADDTFLNLFGVNVGKALRLKRISETQMYNPKWLARTYLPPRVLESCIKVGDQLGSKDNFFATIVEMVYSVRQFPLVTNLRDKFKQAGSRINAMCIDKRNWPVRLRYTHRWSDIVTWAMGQTHVSLPSSMLIDTRYDSDKLKGEVQVAENWYSSAKHKRKGDLWIAVVYLHRVFGRTSGWIHSL